MSRAFRTADYAATLDVQVRLGDCLPPEHLARFVVDSIAQLDLSALYAQYGERGGAPYAPEVLLGLLLYGYLTGVFSTRKMEQATYESAPFRFVAGNMHPDHDTLATFRRAVLPEIKALSVQVLLLACLTGVLQLGRISLDGTKLHADASKSKAVSYQRLRELEAQFQTEIEELFALGEQADRAPLPDGLVVEHELAFRQARLERLAEARAVLEGRAQERDAAEQAAYGAKLAEREERAERTGKPPRGRPPQPPVPGPRPTDQYNFTDPESRIMKNSRDQGVNQDYNAQVAVDQASLLIVGDSLSNHPNDQAEVVPTLDAIAPEVGTLEAAALDAGYFSATNIQALLQRGIAPYIATGRDPHHPSWQERFAQEPAAPLPDASLTVHMAYRLRTALGKTVYAARKSTVEPVIGIIKEVMGFRQFSLRGLAAAAGEWSLVCLAWNFKRLHVLGQGALCP